MAAVGHIMLTNPSYYKGRFQHCIYVKGSAIAERPRNQHHLKIQLILGYDVVCVRSVIHVTHTQASMQLALPITAGNLGQGND